MSKLPELLPMPVRPAILPFTVKWLSGEGAGSWFSVKQEKNSLFEISRFSPKGEVECKGIFKADSEFQVNNDFTISYPSHCQKVTILQEDTTITMTNIAT